MSYGNQDITTHTTVADKFYEIIVTQVCLNKKKITAKCKWAGNDFHFLPSSDII